ncbi:MAG: HlyD family efflux transporter periplasmic adaptor subunit [Pirellulales bacterium]|nr:HlyD family efflux transporter periplasmic adaptor subunit [Pirellulales bacterium]
MATLADSLVSSSARQLTLRKRPDLTAEKQRYQGCTYWVVKDPVGLNYFRFHEEEYAILQMLDGKISLDEIKERFERQFPPEKITVTELQQFLGTLHRSGLVIANVPGQGHQLRLRHGERRRKELLGALSNVLAIRFKGIDPDRLLTWMLPHVRFMFHPATVTLCMLFALSALTLVTVQFDVFQSKLPTFHQFFTLQNAFWLSVTLGVTKVIHEFGHGLSCKYFGGECHEMGVMVLVLTPCLYCNVSDSWMLPNKWHRAAIGAAGMYIEVVIASICTFIWWFSEPGMLNHLALSTMFVCSVSTLIFNANPLLRYDGYYILSDITEIPNLRQKATSILSRTLSEWCLGIEQPDDPFLPERNQMFFAAYSVAAAVYRWFVVFSIMWFLYKIFEPYRLQIIGQAIILLGLYGLLVQPLWKLGKFFYVPGRIDKVKRKNLLGSLAVVAAVAAAILFIPLPFRVLSTFEVQPHNARPVYIDVPGTLEKIDVREGAVVEKGTQLAMLSSIDVQIDISKLEGQRALFTAQIDSLERQILNNDRLAALQLPDTKVQLETVLDQLRERETDRKRLTLTAPMTGTVLPPPETPKKDDPTRQLPTWHGTPLQHRNLGSFLQPGVLFCQIGDPKKLEAVLVVDQADIDFLAEGQEVDLKLDELPGETFHGTIHRISKDELKVSPKQLSNKAGGELPTKTDESGVERPLSTSYQAQVLLEDPSGVMRLGLRGTAKIHAGHRTIGQRLYRFLYQTFNFRM